MPLAAISEEWRIGLCVKFFLHFVVCRAKIEEEYAKRIEDAGKILKGANENGYVGFNAVIWQWLERFCMFIVFFKCN